ncbi:MAG: beta strand repeat-containing protein, partial [Vicinamibacterales bacterium]
AVTVANLNPVPTISGLSPSALAAGSASASVTVNGAGFVSGTQAQWDGSTRPTTIVSTTQLQADISGDVASPGSHTVTVINPTPGGGTSNGVTFTVTVPPPAPTITTIAPSSVAILSAAFPLTVTGTGFAANSVVKLNDVAKPTTYTSSTQLTATIPASDLTTATVATITVVTPGPGGGASNGVPLAITGPALNVSATLVPPGATVTLTLTNGVGGATDWLALANHTAPDTSYLQYEYVGAGVTTTTWTVPMPTVVGAYEFRLFSSNGYRRLAVSPTVTVANVNPVPTISGLSPSAVAAGSAAFTLTANGTGFVSGVTTLEWDGAPLTLISASATQLNATVPATDVASQGTHTVTVSNPTPGGGTSSGTTFTVTAPPPAPTITTISPSSVPILGAAFPLTVNGTGFAANSVVRINGANRVTTYKSSTRLTATIPASDLTSATTATITVLTPPPGGGTSNGVSLAITGPSLSVSATLVPRGATVTVTLTNGTGTALDWLALANSTAPDISFLQYRYVGSGLTTTTWTVTMPTTLGTYEFRLFSNNSYTRLAASPSVSVVNPAPVVSGLTPAAVTAGSGAFSLTVNGSGFVSGVSAGRWDGSPRPTTVVTDTQLRMDIGAADVASQGTHTVTVVNAAPGGGTSVAATLSATAPPPPPTVTATPAVVGLGAPISVTVADGPGAAADWVGLYCPATQPDSSYADYQYLNGSKNPPALGLTTAALTFTAPSVIGLTCNVRLFSNGAYIKLATSGTVTVSPLVTLSSTSAAPGTAITATLTNGLGGAGDFLVLALSTAGDATFVRLTPLIAGATTRAWTFPLPRTAGTYEVRLFNAGGMRLTTSAPVAATGTACVDTDGDLVCDAYETNTGVYVSPINTGTNPNVADTDGDGINDGDEVFGTIAGLNLPAMGTNPLKKNILLEYDWFDDNSEPGTCIAHTHRPTQAMLD